MSLFRFLRNHRHRVNSISHQLAASPFSTTTTTRKIPVLYKPKPFSSDPSNAIPPTARTVQLLSWGNGATGQLGGGVEEVRLYPSPIADLVSPSFALSPLPGSLKTPGGTNAGAVEVGISCGLFHSSLLVDGKLWIWGKGDGGRLGFGHENTLFEPTLNPNVDSISCMNMGALHSIVLNSHGELFSWGYGGFGSLGHFLFKRELFPRLVDGSWRSTGTKIRHFATGGTHTAAITESGVLYTWGRDTGEGRLGLGPDPGPDDTGGLAIPSKVEFLPVPIAAVSCGAFFTMALTEDGKVWNWGANSNYELGRGNKIGGWEPKPLTSLEDFRIIQVSCGGYHTLALTDNGKVLSWGHGERGQLGHSSLDCQKVPAVIEALADERVVFITCGGSTSAAVTDDGKLFMWGNNKDSQIGVPGLPDIQSSPARVNFLTEDDDLGPHKVLSVSIGAYHTLCLASRSSNPL